MKKMRTIPKNVVKTWGHMLLANHAMLQDSTVVGEVNSRPLELPCHDPNLVSRARLRRSLQAANQQMDKCQVSTSSNTGIYEERHRVTCAMRQPL